LKIAVQGLKLIIPKELQFTADRILKSTLRPGTADNDINADPQHGHGALRVTWSTTS
jgi:hypothetical protein